MVALLTVLVWGTTFINTKILLQSLTPTALLLLRFILGYLAFLFMVRKPIGFHGWKREALFAAAGLTGITLYFLVEHMALQNTSAGNVCVIVSTAPLFTALLKHLTDPTSKKLTKRFFLGFVLAIGGIALITFGGQQVHLSPIGDLTALLSALMWALYNLTTERLERAGESAMAVTRRIFFLRHSVYPAFHSAYRNNLSAGRAVYPHDRAQPAFSRHPGFRHLFCQLELRRPATGPCCHQHLHLSAAGRHHSSRCPHPARTSHTHLLHRHSAHFRRAPALLVQEPFLCTAFRSITPMETLHRAQLMKPLSGIWAVAFSERFPGRFSLDTKLTHFFH